MENENRAESSPDFFLKKNSKILHLEKKLFAPPLNGFQKQLGKRKVKSLECQKLQQCCFPKIH